MTSFAHHFDYQPPNCHTRVGYLLDSIETIDDWLQVAISAIWNDKGATGMRRNFEAAAAHLLLMDPVAKRQEMGTKWGTIDISYATAEVYYFGSKPGIGKTGVHLCCHTDAEYKRLKKEQPDELREWRKSNSTRDMKAIQRRPRNMGIDSARRPIYRITWLHSYKSKFKSNLGTLKIRIRTLCPRRAKPGPTAWHWWIPKPPLLVRMQVYIGPLVTPQTGRWHLK